MVDFINKVSIFSKFTTEHKAYLLTLLEERNYKEGEYIIEEGDRDKNLYLVRAGHVKILKQNEEGEFVDIAYVGEGEYFGELSLIDHEPRSAYVKAISDSQILNLTLLNYSNLCLKFPELEALMLKEFLHDIIYKLRRTSEDAINKRLLL